MVWGRQSLACPPQEETCGQELLVVFMGLTSAEGTNRFGDCWCCSLKFIYAIKPFGTPSAFSGLNKVRMRSC